MEFTNPMLSRNVPATPPPADIPVTPLPPVVGGPEEGPGPEVPTPPIAPPGQPPVAPGPGVPSLPIAPPGQPPVAPGPGVPSLPIAPPGQPPIPTFPSFPSFPSVPSMPNAATVRFLHAVMDGEPVRITVGTRLIASNLQFGGLTGYFNFAPGFRTVTVYSARQPWVILYQSSIPFNAGEIMTLALVRAGGVLDLVRISDAPCTNQPRNRACIRAINLVYNSPALDVVLADGRVVFTDVRYKEVTTPRQARPQTYDFYIAQTPYSLAPAFTDIQTVEDMPMVLPDYYLPGYGSVEPLVSFYVEATAGAMESIYILGNWNISRALRVRVVENV